VVMWVACVGWTGPHKATTLMAHPSIIQHPHRPSIPTPPRTTMPLAAAPAAAPPRRRGPPPPLLAPATPPAPLWMSMAPAGTPSSLRAPRWRRRWTWTGRTG
jgi:hypothetical protein